MDITAKRVDQNLVALNSMIINFAEEFSRIVCTFRGENVHASFLALIVHAHTKQLQEGGPICSFVSLSAGICRFSCHSCSNSDWTTMGWTLWCPIKKLRRDSIEYLKLKWVKTNSVFECLRSSTIGLKSDQCICFVLLAFATLSSSRKEHSTTMVLCWLRISGCLSNTPIVVSPR